MEPREKQVEKDAYRFESYGGVDRFASYHYQLREVIAKKPHSVLEVGVGDKVFGEYLNHNTDIEYTSIDIAEDLNPDVLGDVTDMPFKDSEFDIVCAFEVLEHLPFEEFEKAFREMYRVARTHVMISIPHFGPPVQFWLKLPLLPRMRFAIKVPYPKVHHFNGQHHWEVGKKGYPPARIRREIQKTAPVTKEFVPFENQYHHFYIVEKKS